MGSTWRRMGVLLLAVTFVFGTSVSFAAPKAEFAPVRIGTLSGVVADTSGKALSGMTVSLVGGGKVISQTKTDKAGKYTIENLAAGKFDVLVASAPPVKIMASADAESTTLKIVLPQRAGQSQAWVGGTVFYVVAGGTVATAVVTTAVISNNTGGDLNGGEVRRVITGKE